MNIILKKWDKELKDNLIEICNKVDRSFLSDRLPYPYTEASADWYLGMVAEHDSKDGVFRAIIADGKVIGNISVEQKSDVYGKDGDIGDLLLTDYWSKGIMIEAVRQICEIAFSELSIIRITGLVSAPNIASQRVLEKMGS
jgi:ribosomal-protein-alanine acetyltransferase